MDLTPLVPAGRQVIERYGPSGFRVAGVIWRGPVLVFPDLTMAWMVQDAAGITGGITTGWDIGAVGLPAS